VRIFKNKAFLRFARKADLRDAALCEAIRDVERRLISAVLGGGVIKQRIARGGQGKSGGFRTLIVFKAGARAFFVHGFAKNEQDNIRPDEVVALRRLAFELLAYDDEAIARGIASGVCTFLGETQARQDTTPQEQGGTDHRLAWSVMPR
jgi:hypothetical protein